ncbi:MAG TPA: cation:proton antiporter [Nitrolancea sp.]|nr:cation:proton antiporter [Nitrolancea sp.]
MLTVGVATVGLAVATRLIRNLSLSSALLATCVGVVLGPRVAGVLVPPAHGGRHEVLLEAAEIALATSLMALARRFTPQQLRAATPRAARLVGFGMPGMALLTGAGAWLIFDVSFWPGMLIGASLAATDPVVAAALVSGRLAERNIPAWLRHVLELEAGSNDCLAVVLVLLPVAVLTHSEPVGPWLGDAAQEVGLAIGAGIASGALAALALRALRRAPGLDDDALRPVPLGLTIAVLALVDLLGGSGVLGVFAAGLTFSSLVTAEERHTTQQTQGPPRSSR